MHLLKKCWQNIRVFSPGEFLPGKAFCCRSAVEQPTASGLDTMNQQFSVTVTVIKKGAEAPFYLV
jgi:hypothetical protein